MIERPRISVIIPAIKNTSSLTELVQSLDSLDIAEILITGPQITLPVIGDKVRHLSAPIGRGPQIQAGLNAAMGNIIWILHSDSEIPPHAVKAIRKIMAKPSVSMGCFLLEFDKRGFWVSLFAFISRFDSPFSTFGDQGFFFSRGLVQYLPDLTQYPLMEDVVLRRALMDYGGVKKSALSLKTSARLFNRDGPLRTQIKNAEFLWRFWRGVSSAKLYQDYYATASTALRSKPALKPRANLPILPQ